jgi:hypothetical protein
MHGPHASACTATAILEAVTEKQTAAFGTQLLNLDDVAHKMRTQANDKHVAKFMSQLRFPKKNRSPGSASPAGAGAYFGRASGQLTWPVAERPSSKYW